MPHLKRDDGVEIHWEEWGEGPLVVIVPHWSGMPEVFDPLIAELSRDHRAVRYDARGTGESTRRGPYDMDTGSADLAALIEAAGGTAVALGMTDAPHRAVRVATRRPDLVRVVISVGGAPLSVDAFAGSDAMVASRTVVKAFLEQMERDYRAGLRALLTATNPQMSEEELRDRVRRTVEYRPREVGVALLRAWVADDAAELGGAMGERLWIIYPPERPAGAWFPPGREFAARIRELLPDAHLREIEEGVVSRPDITAEIVRRVTAPLRTPAG